MIHTSNYLPAVLPVYGDCTRDEIDRLQDMSVTVALNREKIQEIGRVGTVAWRKNTPSVQVSLKQNEYGSIAFWNTLANKPAATTTLALTDFTTTAVDICGYKTDDSGVYLGTVQYPKLRIAGFGINIGDPASIIERNFSLVGEDEFYWQANNKYVVTLRDAGATAGAYSIVIGSGAYTTYPTPVYDPDVSGNTSFIQKVIRIRSGVSTELTYIATAISAGTPDNYGYTSGSKTIGLWAQVGDIYKVWYTATTYISGVQPFVNNDSDIGGTTADSATILLTAGNTVYRLQSVGLDVSFERVDKREIGNTAIVARGVKNKTVKVTLGRVLEAYTIEEILRGKLGASWGKLDMTKFGSSFKLFVKTYSDNTKSTFKLGYSADVLAPTGFDNGVPLQDYVTRSATLEGEQLTITNVEGSM